MIDFSESSHNLGAHLYDGLVLYESTSDEVRSAKQRHIIRSFAEVSRSSSLLQNPDTLLLSQDRSYRPIRARVSTTPPQRRRRRLTGTADTLSPPTSRTLGPPKLALKVQSHQAAMIHHYHSSSAASMHSPEPPPTMGMPQLKISQIRRRSKCAWSRPRSRPGTGFVPFSYSICLLFTLIICIRLKTRI